ncbi:MAG: chorismate-binding protein [candidate division Zixibacteria bacterium]|nr:chorismate-binding protein [candidate division Zixibacteria bacterium]
MRLSAVEDYESFALLGPGFGNGRFILLTGLHEDSPPQLVYTSFETSGARPRGFRCESMEAVDIEFDVTPRAVTPILHDDGYRDIIERIRTAIAGGDVYQVCYTVRAEIGPTTGAELLTLMCGRGVPRFAAWVHLPDGTEFVSASPELFFETDGCRVHSEPMKGTAAPDAAGFLVSSEKDLAELAMITDLIRNDLTQVCVPRSVTVACERRIIELPYALQTVSDVVGEMAEGMTPLDILAALHPGGSVTGTPKTAALAMIQQIETGPRGAYCGCLGLWDGDRSTFSLLIRTAAKTPAGWVYGVGGGIVYDSEAEREHDELHIKLGALSLMDGFRV